MKKTLLEKISRWAAENNVLNNGTLVVAGVSGGADSVCLLHVLNSLRKANGFSIVAIHINHMLRAEESIQDEKFVRDICRQWGISLKVFSRDVKAYSKEKGYSLEEAGRILRYDLFHSVRNELNARHIAVAHHKEDQAETVFLNLLRGSGLNGLCGMEDVHGYIIRPLLNTGKNEIYEYLARNNLQYRVDSSNLSNVHIRNAIRNSIFPGIKKETGFPVTSSLVRMAGLLKADRDYLKSLAEEYYKLIEIQKTGQSVELDRNRLAALDQAIGGRIIRIAWEAVTGTRKGLESKHVEAALKLTGEAGKNKAVDFPSDIRFKAEYGSVFVSKKEDKAIKPVFIKVEAPSDVILEERRIMAVFRVYTTDEYEEKFERFKKPEEKSLIQLFDYNSVSEGINIRYRLPGDTFIPYNGPGKKKLKDFFIDQKIPRHKRDRMLLLADGKDIIWIIGLRTSGKYRVTRFTKKILYVEITGYDNTIDGGTRSEA